MSSLTPERIREGTAAAKVRTIGVDSKAVVEGALTDDWEASHGEGRPSIEDQGAKQSQWVEENKLTR